MSAKHSGMWGVGAANRVPLGTPDSHRCKPFGKRRGETVNGNDVAALAEELGLSPKRVQRELTHYRKRNIVPSWALN